MNLLDCIRQTASNSDYPEVCLKKICPESNGTALYDTHLNYSSDLDPKVVSAILGGSQTFMAARDLGKY